MRLDLDESRAFDYFLHEVAPCLSGAQDAAFWTLLVPQVCHSDAATRDAVLVISHMFECPPDLMTGLSGARDDSRHAKVLKWHSRSINGYRTRLEYLHGLEQTELALLSCILLTSIQYQQNNIRNAMNLLKIGYDLASNIPPNGLGSTSPAMKELLIPILARQTVLMITFGARPPP